MVEIRSVSKSFGSLKAVDNVSLYLEKGTFTALLGPNGAGKTTLVEMVEGLQVPDTGSILIAGMNWRYHAPQLRRIVGLCLQETRFIDKLTVKETLRLFASFYGIGTRRIEEVMEMVQLREKKNSYTEHLSGGQKQRLALAISLLHQPELLILDEPTTGLDPLARRQVWQLLVELQQQTSLTLLLTTHYMEEAEHLCQRIVIMDKGRILADGSLQELLEHFDTAEEIQLQLLTHQRCPDYWQGILASVEGISKMHVYPLPEGIAITLEVERAAVVLPSLMSLLSCQPAHLRQVHARRKTLDDLFALMTGKRLQE